MNNPTLAITIGDISGIGPEITAKTLLLHPELREICVPIAYGDANSLRHGCEVAGLDPNSVHVLTSPSDATNDPNRIEVIQVGPELERVELGKVSATAGDGAYRFVVAACDDAKKNLVQGIVTAPLNKEAMHAGGHLWPGHTEILAHEFGVENYSMILSADDLFLFHLTTHQSLKSAVDSCTPDRTYNVIKLAAALGKANGHPEWTIGVCGINPHAGENRLFGDEDQDQLLPGIQRAQEEGINVTGPLPADALIPAAVKGKYNLVIACYHDQGHAPFKAVYGDNGVNITSGLPVVRVSVDHGTAFDIAGKGIAREESLVLATRRAAELSSGWADVWTVASS
ncbi:MULTISPECIES: 4-hydroxythreonine-4-phosphate dehydrogenase PdxA [Corynebacterium]|uniref:4-hydroxythreonine-4-phosphate dehydrogenase PdxA n=1 Tax=Corynebacterium TaxID=1716 RepID=UPI0009F4060A|nr:MULTISPECIES: 4-hydroxythreonine-4-phosphate dehydrogenase PdxA [Corynebacterium]MDK6814237.1 4-hydroxythreonine-4-phosphate dehydrogenase PdxA [Corynebacterium sp. UMB6689]QQU95851.1 4-hydroxythreonine-4-phosphate dehydrogenase PdxA [Corynebacterium aurimucosum]UTA71253.1 4-hydroxythreonine-4-phosphate dehydrogenase PdxA [Corynebacterium aurimucosum]WJY69428.1 4-hydroxythreonine-4-phosphate dehydrogenase 2 [Corynebacterium aurimucosum]